MSKTLLRHTLIKKYFDIFVDFLIFIHLGITLSALCTFNNDLYKKGIKDYFKLCIQVVGIFYYRSRVNHS
jgi:hypothetical protein